MAEDLKPCQRLLPPLSQLAPISGKCAAAATPWRFIFMHASIASRAARANPLPRKLTLTMSPKTREDHIAFDRNYCEHYSPQPGSLKKDYCALGCGASERMDAGRKAGEPNMTPCIGGHTAKDVHTLCPKWQRRSMEHAEKRADDMERRLAQMAQGMKWASGIRKQYGKGKGGQGKDTCPVCGGTVHWSCSSYNGHMRVQCETADCLNWIE